ncbi:MAG TPA: ABC transporter ATP-binding protein [Spirochaetia bacterium]|nr:ABC transporter ATP-binding protein [Spirochaetia bacterium]
MTCGRLVASFFRSRAVSYSVGVVFLLATNLLVLGIPRVLGTLTDLLAQGRASDPQVGTELLVLVLLGFAIFGTRLVWRYLLWGNARVLEVYLRDALFAHLQTLPVSFYTERKTGDLMSYAISDVQAIRMAFGAGILQTIDGIMVAGIAIAFMSGLVNPGLVALTLAPLTLAVGLIVGLSGPIRGQFLRVQASFATLSDRVQESLAGIRVIKAFSQEKATVEAFGRVSSDRVEAQVGLARISGLLGPGIQICFGFSFLIFLLLGSNLVQSGAMSVGAFVATNLYILTILGPVTSISRIIELLQKGRASYQRLDGLFAIEPAPGLELPPTEHEFHGRIEVRDLSFRYPGGSRDALSGIGFSVGPGQILGIIGPTGSGKTTLVSLLLRLHPVVDRTVFIDGQDLNDLSLATLRENIGYVPQDHFLFSTTIKGNIEFFRPDYSDEEIEDAARQSGIYESIAAFPDGFDTQVGERGVTLSGGQKQRISIARALVKDPAILILDDSLSAVDSRTEAQILANFRSFLANRTGIVISHRVATVQGADEILVLEDGRISDRGTHADLVRREGLYARLCQIQEAAP